MRNIVERGRLSKLAMLWFTAGILAASPTPSVAQPTTWKPGTYIDVHSHLQGRYREAGSLITDYSSAAASALQRIDELGIAMVIWMPPPQPFGFPHPIYYTDFVAAVRAHSRRFAFLGGGGTLNPLIYESVSVGQVTSEIQARFDRAASAIVRDGAKGFGEMTAMHLSFRPRHPFLAVQPDHPLFLRLADIAADHGMPIDLHMEAVAEDVAPLPRFASAPNPKFLRENIRGFERLLTHNRGANIVWAHVGWDNTGHQTVTLLNRLLAAHPNLHLQVKIGLRPPPGAWRSPGARNRPVDQNMKLRPEWRALMEKFPERFLFAADHFFGIPGRTRRIGRGGNSNEILDQLPATLAKQIAFDNPVRIYNLQ